jgi:hypothetical protein
MLAALKGCATSVNVLLVYSERHADQPGENTGENEKATERLQTARDIAQVAQPGWLR